MVVATINKIDTFLCGACLIEKELKDKSPDGRYCCWCFNYLSGEAKNYNSPRPWMPRREPIRHKAHKDKSITATIKRLEKKANGGKGGVGITSQAAVKPAKIIKKAVTPQKTRETIPPQNVTAKNVTTKRIFELAKEGLTTRAIAKIVGVSHMTVARRLAGQLELI